MMKLWVLGQWAVALSVAGGAIATSALPAAAQATGHVDESEPPIHPSAPLPTHLSTPQPATTVEEWLAQIEASLIQITGVQIQETEAGLQIVFETAEGELATPTTEVVGNALIAEIPNAVLALPEGDSFEQFEPAAGIALVQVTNAPGDQVRVAITGTDAPPVGEVTATGLTVTLGEAVAETDEDAIQVVVTGEEDEGYNPSSATTATRTDTPLRDIPASIQVVPRQVIEDRNARNVEQALETVSGVTGSFDAGGVIAGGRFIRGFSQFGNLRNGLSQGTQFNFYSLDSIETVERVEVLKGPASILFGALEPGGVVNVVTRQPLDEPYYRIGFEAANRNFYQPTVDFSGPLTADDKILYRLIASYETFDGFQRFVNGDQVSIAPSITVNFSDQTNLNLYYEYNNFSGLPAFSGDSIVRQDGSFLTSQDFFLGYPDFFEIEYQTQRFGYTFNHNFSDNLELRNSIAVKLDRYERNLVAFGEVQDDRTLVFSNGNAEKQDTEENVYFGQIDLLGRFDTGSISHQILAGFDATYINFHGDIFDYDVSSLPNLDILNPNYEIIIPPISTVPRSFNYTSQSYGVYLQDQISFSDNLKLLVGGRYDWVSDEDEFEGFVTQLDDAAFSPRIGLVYQPSETASIYASYSRSFTPSNFSFQADGARGFEPTRGTQYEVGFKGDFLDGRLSTTLAAYHLTRTNVVTPDPDPVLAAQGFSVQTGEQRSQGIELDVAGEILPGWNVILAYAYTDAEVTDDNAIPEGNRLPNVPEHQASLWTTYEIQSGDLQGLGFGLGLFYVGERQGNLTNDFVLQDFFRTDASVFYSRDGFRAALNARNVFDIDYAEYTEGRFNVFRGEPLTITGSVSWTF